MARSKTSTGAAPKLPTGIYLLADGRYMAKVAIGTDPDTGAIKFARPKSPSLDVVIERRREILDRLKTGEKVGGPREKTLTTAEWAQHWLESVVGAKRSASTYDNYRWCINALLVKAPKGVRSIGPIPFRELTTQRIEEWRNALERAGVGIPSINYGIRCLRAMYNVALARPEMGVSANRAAAVDKLPELPKTPYVGDPSETRRMIEAAGEHYMASLIQVATDAGLRRSEICGLQWGDIDFAQGTLTLRRHVVASGDQGAGHRVTRIIPGTKESGGKPEEVQVSDRALAMLLQTRDRLAFVGKSWKGGTRSEALYVANARARTGTAYVIPTDPTAPDAFVWPAADGDIYQPTSLGNWFSALARKAGITTGKTLHDMRHDCATFLIGRNEPITVVARQMRHRDASITASTYAHLLKGQEMRARASFNSLWNEVYSDEETAVAV